MLGLQFVEMFSTSTVIHQHHHHYHHQQQWSFQNQSKGYIIRSSSIFDLSSSTSEEDIKAISE